MGDSERTECITKEPCVTLFYLKALGGVFLAVFMDDYAAVFHVFSVAPDCIWRAYFVDACYTAADGCLQRQFHHLGERTLALLGIKPLRDIG